MFRYAILRVCERFKDAGFFATLRMRDVRGMLKNTLDSKVRNRYRATVIGISKRARCGGLHSTLLHSWKLIVPGSL
jgi:hypothetical protein